MRKAKSWLACILCVVLLFSYTVAASALEIPLKKAMPLTSIEELMKIGVDPAYPPDGEYSLESDINGNDMVFTPIGNEESPFSGVLHGNGHVLSNLVISGDQAGFFHTLNGSVRNMTFENISVSGNIAGILAANIQGNANITDIFITGRVTRMEAQEEEQPVFVAGAFAGRATGAIHVERVCVFAAVDGAEEKRTGAFIGDNGAAEECFADNLWSSAYAQPSAFGVDSAVNTAQGVYKVETEPSYLALNIGGEAGRLSVNKEMSEKFGLTFKEFTSSGSPLISLTQKNGSVTILPQQEIGATEVVAVYEKVHANGDRTQIYFATPVIISSEQAHAEKEPIEEILEDAQQVDAILPAQITQEQVFVDPLLPNRWVE